MLYFVRLVAQLSDPGRAATQSGEEERKGAVRAVLGSCLGDIVRYGFRD